TPDVIVSPLDCDVKAGSCDHATIPDSNGVGSPTVWPWKSRADSDDWRPWNAVEYPVCPPTRSMTFAPRRMFVLVASSIHACVLPYNMPPETTTFEDDALTANPYCGPGTLWPMPALARPVSTVGCVISTGMVEPVHWIPA